MFLFVCLIDCSLDFLIDDLLIDWLEKEVSCMFVYVVKTTSILVMRDCLIFASFALSRDKYANSQIL